MSKIPNNMIKKEATDYHKAVIAVGPTSVIGRLSPLARIIRKIRELFEGLFAMIFSSRHPGGYFIRLTIAFPWLFNWMTPNDKWSLGAHVRFWAKCLAVAPRDNAIESKRIFFFCAYRGQFTIDLPLAFLLAWRGHRITFGYLPKLQSPTKEPLGDYPSAKLYLAMSLGQIVRLSAGRINCVDLSEITFDDLPVNETTIQSKVKSDVVMYLRRESVDMSDPACRKAWAYYEKQARQAQQLALTYLRRTLGQFDLIIIANGTTFEAAQFCAVAKELKIPVTTFEKFAFKHHRVINHGDDFQNFNDLSLAWNHREELGYLEPQFLKYAAMRATNLLDERRRASRESWSWVLQSAPHQNRRQALIAAGVPQNTQFALVCSNVPFDAGYGGLLGKFSSMKEWLVETIRHLLDKTSIHVVLRAHPAESAHWGGRELSSETIKEFLGNPRLTFVAHDQEVNTYGLMEEAKFGVVFSSTTGLEMAMLGKFVIPGANVYYDRRGFTVDSVNRDDYFSALTRFAEADNIVELDRSQVNSARLFHFILHYVMQWPFPYDKPNDVRRLPPHHLLASEKVDSYIRFIDALTLTIEEGEWLGLMSKYLSADGVNHVPTPYPN